MRKIVLGAVLLLASNMALADVYKCKGADGSTKFQDKPCATSEKQVAHRTQPKSGAANASLKPPTGGRASSATASSGGNSSGFGPNSDECRKRKAILAEYQSTGVKGYNPATGQTGMMTGEDAAYAIQLAKDNVDFYCSAQN